MSEVVESVFQTQPKEDKELKRRQEEQLAREARREAENDRRIAAARRSLTSREAGRRLLIASETGELGVMPETLG